MVFFEQLAISPRPLLMLDFDGTLAPFAVERNRVIPYPGVVERLNRIAQTKTRLVIISGRALCDLNPLLRLESQIEMWGSHGFERQIAPGTYRTPDLSRRTKDGLKQAEIFCKRHLDPARYEIKPASIAVHWRGLSPSEKKEIENEVIPAFKILSDTALLDYHEFNGGVELRSNECNKGKAVALLISETCPEDAIAYLGDDVTDEDAFKALAGRGLTILVSNDLIETNAAIQIKPPDELLQFLDKWIETCNR